MLLQPLVNPRSRGLFHLLLYRVRLWPRVWLRVWPRVVAATVSLLAGAVSCREAVSAFGTGARARASTDQLFTALADRHADIVRNATYDYARIQLSRGALSPSRVFDDTASWTGLSGPVRILETFGTHTDGKYVMSAHRGVTAPAKPADGRHITTLSQLSDDVYRWDTNVDFGIGSVRPNDIALVVSRLMSAGEGLTEREARANLTAATPRTSAVLGTAFSLDTLRPTALADGSTAVTLVFSVHSDQLRQRFPVFGDYVHKYVDPARFRIALTDHGGAPFLEAHGHDRTVTVRLRTIDGHLAPLGGVLRPLPDSLVLQADFTVKLKVFHVGFHELAMDFVNTSRDDVERMWTVTAHKEPKWNLPFITARLLRSPLRRPFEGEGALFRIGVRAEASDLSTVLVRQSRLTVQESAILKFINSLSNSAMDDFGGRAEKEQNQWLRELFLAMRDDAHGVLTP